MWFGDDFVTDDKLRDLRWTFSFHHRAAVQRPEKPEREREEEKQKQIKTLTHPSGLLRHAIAAAAAAAVAAGAADLGARGRDHGCGGGEPCGGGDR